MASAVTKLATASPTSGYTTTFSAISGSYDDLVLIGSAKNNSTGSSIRTYNTMYFRLSGDSGSNYSWADWGAENASLAGNGVLFPLTTRFDVDGCASSYSTNVGWGHFYLYFAGYKDTGSTKSIQVRSGYTQDASTAATVSIGAANWDNTAAITSIEIGPLYGTFVAGTNITLYGISNS